MGEAIGTIAWIIFFMFLIIMFWGEPNFGDVLYNYLTAELINDQPL